MQEGEDAGGVASETANLFLSPRKLEAPLSDGGVIPIREALDEVMRVGRLGSGDNWWYRVRNSDDKTCTHPRQGAQVGNMIQLR